METQAMLSNHLTQFCCVQKKTTAAPTRNLVERRMTAVEPWTLDRCRGLVEYDHGESYESTREQLQTGRTQGVVSVTEGRGQRNQTQQTYAYPVHPAMLHVSDLPLSVCQTTLAT